MIIVSLELGYFEQGLRFVSFLLRQGSQQTAELGILKFDDNRNQGPHERETLMRACRTSLARLPCHTSSHPRRLDEAVHEKFSIRRAWALVLAASYASLTWLVVLGMHAARVTDICTMCTERPHSSRVRQSAAANVHAIRTSLVGATPIWSSTILSVDAGRRHLP